MKCIVTLVLLALAGVAVAQSVVNNDIYRGSASEKKGLVMAGISDRINPIVAQAEAAYRRGTNFASPVFVQGDVQDAINKALGARVSLFVQIESVSGRSAIARVNVRSKPIWTAWEQSQYDRANKELDWLMKNKPRADDPVTSYNNRVNSVKKLIGDIRRSADANAKERAPDAVVQIDFDALPANVKPGAKVTLAGWVKEVTVKPVTVDYIPYAKVIMAVQHEDLRVFGEASTQPETPTTRPLLADSLGSSDQPAVATTQPGALYFGTTPKAEAATQPAE